MAQQHLPLPISPAKSFEIGRETMPVIADTNLKSFGKAAWTASPASLLNCWALYVAREHSSPHVTFHPARNIAEAHVRARGKKMWRSHVNTCELPVHRLSVRTSMISAHR